MTISADPQVDAPAVENPKRQQIMDGARRMFMSKGFEGASMQDVAKAAGVSKGTLYVYFDSKEAVFEALVLKECGLLQAEVRRIGSGVGPVEDELRAIALQMVATLLHGEKLAAIRMMIGAGEKFPELARHIYQAGPARSVSILAEYLQLRQAQGDLALSDCTEGASIFLDMVFAGLQRRALLMMPPLGQAQLVAHVTRRVDCFLALCRAIAPDGPVQD